jgi:hypothetical protein
MWTTHRDAENFIKAPNDKIKVVFYVTKICPECDDFIPDVLEPLLAKYGDHFDYVKVDSDDPDIVFPAQAYPTGYFYIPDTSERMPLIRYGGAVPDHVEDDLQAMIEVKDLGKTVEQAFFVDRRPGMFPYGQGKPNPRNAMPAEASIQTYEKMKHQPQRRVVDEEEDTTHVKSDWTKKL